MKVLIVEDHVDAREMLMTLLELQGMETQGAATGLEAVDMIQTWRPDAAVIDFVLPDIDGCELARRVRNQLERRDMVLMALTGHSDERAAAAAAEAGFDHFFVKPIDPEAVIRTLRQARDTR